MELFSTGYMIQQLPDCYTATAGKVYHRNTYEGLFAYSVQISTHCLGRHKIIKTSPPKRHYVQCFLDTATSHSVSPISKLLPIKYIVRFVY